MGKCECGLKEMTFLGNTTTSEGMYRDEKKVSDFLSTPKILKIPKHIRRLIGFLK